ncbi:MAG: hypothetical protein GX061_05525 [Eubacteriaceae bacterium]|nr:hypothetical protein [Eubacteriaceae bacterium]
MICPRCLKTNDEDAKYCEFCGENLITPTGKSDILTAQGRAERATYKKAVKKNVKNSLLITVGFVVAVFLTLCTAEYLITGDNFLFDLGKGFSGYSKAGEAFMDDFLEGQISDACALSDGLGEDMLKAAGYDSRGDYGIYVRESYNFLYYEHCINLNYGLNEARSLNENEYYMEYTVNSSYNGNEYSDVIGIYCTKYNNRWYPVFKEFN